MRHKLATAVLGSLLFISAPALAHIDLIDPAPRSHSALKAAPCGPLDNTRSGKPTYFMPGQQVTLKWNETINHPAHYRVMLDMNGSSFTDPSSFTDVCDPAVPTMPMCIADNLADKAGGAYTYTFTLPNVECANCTIQLIQVMTDKPPYGDGNDVYHACADIVISTQPDPATTSATTGSGPSTSAGNGSGTGSASGGAGGAGSGDSGSGCAVGGSGGRWSGLAGGWVIALAGLGRRRRSV